MTIQTFFKVSVMSVLISSMLSCHNNSVSNNTYSQYPIPSDVYDEVKIECDSTVFTLWAPSATQVRLNLYDAGSKSDSIGCYAMLPREDGLWRVALPSRLYGKFYTFNVLVEGKWLDETPGIWAKAVGVNGERAAIIDLAATNPEGWDGDRGPEVANITDAVIYEMHHRDFSMHPSSGIVNKGKFLALTEPDTHSPQGEVTGINHLKELGITHVHILPSYDFNSVNEADTTAQYNWGYDPLNYNVPEGSYATDATNPSTRIREMKEMIQSLHSHGIGVIMDVVYNHTALSDGSNFSLTVPGYFYRQSDGGGYSNASGCGNETASERRAVSDYIVNSVKYWAQEYHIDGFRFDLMGIHDLETMNRVAHELKTINPSIIIYGEGWTAGESPLPAEERALKENVAQMNGVAVFSDDLRDAVKGHYSDAKDCGFATGKPGNEETVKIGIVGATNHPQVDYEKGNNSKVAYAAAPTQVINYVSCHDDLSLTDKLAISMEDDNEAERQRAAKLAQTIVFTSQGTPFIFAGEEVFRDKHGIHNTYKSPDSVNAINWELKKENQNLYKYYRQLVKLRKEHPAFRMTTAKDVAENIVFDDTENNLISYSIINNANGDEWSEIKLIFNGGNSDKDVYVAEDEWIVIARDGEINSEGIGLSAGGTITVPHRSATILARK